MLSCIMHYNTKFMLWYWTTYGLKVKYGYPVYKFCKIVEAYYILIC